MPHYDRLSRCADAPFHVVSNVDLFEQQSSTGGVWNHASRAPREELRVPQTNPHQPLEEPTWVDDHDIDSESTAIKPVFTTPIYDTLESNIPHFLMRHSDDPSLENEPLFAGHESVLRYLNTYAEPVRHLIRFCTQVYDIRRDSENGQDRWLVCTRDLKSHKVMERYYDAVAVASGHHYVPRLPDISGIRAWNEAYPKVISHSKYYRAPEEFKDKKVVVIGNSASGSDIAAQIGTVSKHPVLNSKRSEAPEFRREISWKHEVPEIVEFLPPTSARQAVRFANGLVESDIDAVVFCTGYYYSFPFLSSLRPAISTTGERVENIYKHLFYTPHPSLAFVGLPIKIVPFRTYEGQGSVLARIWSGRLELPSASAMRTWEEERIAEQGSGKRFHEMRNLTDFHYHNEMVEWALQAKPKKTDAVPPEWREMDSWFRINTPAIKKAFAEKGKARFSMRSARQLGFQFPG
ncbi:MAG: hypothetical protein Q9183_001732 [Haloplaca sp. 2 TL-2023]